MPPLQAHISSPLKAGLRSTVARRYHLRPALNPSTPRITRLASTTAHTSDQVIPTNKTHPNPQPPNVSATNTTPVSGEGVIGTKQLQEGVPPGRLQEDLAEAEERRVRQAPNRQGVWSRSQNPRGRAMVGPRFEQTIMELQPRPAAAIELIHKQPVRWTDERVVSCNGGGGPLGHPRIFINVDKPQICWCTYCGVPYAHNHHRKHLESQPNPIYPLEPSNDPETVHEPQRVTDGAAFNHR